MNEFSNLSEEVDIRLQNWMKANRHSLITMKKKRAIFIDQSTKLLENFFFKICADTEISQFGECGAHDAYASRKIKSTYPHTMAVAFEANPHVFENFLKLITSADIKYVNKAISNQVGIQMLTLKPKDTKSWSSEGYIEFENSTDSNLEKMVVRTTTLDVELGDSLLEVSTALWIDVEGSNRVLVEGAEKLLKSGLVEAIFIETQVDHVWKGEISARELCEELILYGYVPLARDCPQHWGCNVIFIKHQDLARFAKQKNEYLNQLELIQLPFLPKIQFRTILSNIKNMLIKSQKPAIQKHLHRFFSHLGSKSSRDSL